MSFVGKVLVVLQLVLCLVFMAFAGAVNTMHVNWRKESLKLQDKLKKTSSELADEKTNFEKFKADKTTELTAMQNRAGQAEAANVALKAQVDQLSKEDKDLKVALATANQLAQISSEEAVARRNESITLREINNKLLTSRDAESKAKTKLEDELRSTQLDLKSAQTKVKTLLGDVALRDRILREHGISSEPKDLASSVAAPPRVDGIVLSSKPARVQGNSSLVEISLGSDDGIAKGHRFSVYRSGLKSGEKPRYLGKIRIVQTTPDKAVGEVLEQDRTGAIQEGDNVTTKF